MRLLIAFLLTTNLAFSQLAGFSKYTHTETEASPTENVNPRSVWIGAKINYVVNMYAKSDIGEKFADNIEVSGQAILNTFPWLESANIQLPIMGNLSELFIGKNDSKLQVDIESAISAKDLIDLGFYPNYLLNISDLFSLSLIAFSRVQWFSMEPSNSNDTRVFSHWNLGWSIEIAGTGSEANENLPLSLSLTWFYNHTNNREDFMQYFPNSTGIWKNYDLSLIVPLLKNLGVQLSWVFYPKDHVLKDANLGIGLLFIQ